MKIAVFTPIPTPYRDPFWNVVARRPGVELRVYYCAAGKSDRPWKVSWETRFRSEVLPGVNLVKWLGADASCCWNRGIRRRLREGRYDALVLGGYNHPTMFQAVRWAVRHRLPYFLMCESYSRPRPSVCRQWLKSRLVGWVVGHAAGGFPTGTLARQYLIDYGASPERLVLLPNVPDVAALRRQAQELAPRRGSLRREHGLPERPLVLFAARLIPKKRPDLLIRAFGRVCRELDATLAVVGHGPMRPALERLVDELRLNDRVRLVGFLQPDALPTWYAMADLFVLPSSETWGVVVIEALASGVPVILSNEVGCHPDVLLDRHLGEVVPAGDEEGLARALRVRLENPSNRETAARVWAPIRKMLSYERLADSFLEAVRRPTRAAPARFGAEEVGAAL